MSVLGLKQPKGRRTGPGFFGQALPPGPLDPRRTRRTPPRPERPRRRQAPPCIAGKRKIEIGKRKIEIGKRTVERPHPCMKQTCKDGPPKGVFGIKGRPPALLRRTKTSLSSEGTHQ